MFRHNNTAEYSFNFKMFLLQQNYTYWTKKPDLIPLRIMNRRFNNFCEISSTIELDFREYEE